MCQRRRASRCPTRRPIRGPRRSWPAELRAVGTRLYKARHFAEACIRFEKAAQLVPDDPELLLDLASCLEHLGQVGRARALNTRAIALASQPERVTVARFARLRKNAY